MSLTSKRKPEEIVRSCGRSMFWVSHGQNMVDAIRRMRCSAAATRFWPSRCAVELVIARTDREMLRRLCDILNLIQAVGLTELPIGDQSRLRESAQGDKWSFCLTAGKIW